MTSRTTQLIRDKIEHYAANFTSHAKDNLNIRTKSGQVVPFKLNKAQAYAHTIIEDQKACTGKVRAIVVKARQQGFSTYIAGRYFWKVQFNKGLRCFILTHEMSATENLFGMAKRFWDYMVDPLKPRAGASNAKELYFDNLESGYAVSTAGNKATGRSQTIQLFHGSEVAFWPNDREHAAGVLQAVPDHTDTEVILESTGNGMGNYFYETAMNAYKGIGDFVLIFVPWFMTEEYKIAGGEPEVMTDQDHDYMKAYDLTLAQMAWREKKILELGEYKFMQEYPATIIEAFQASGDDSYIDPATVLKARANVGHAYGPKLLGIDPAGDGKDRTAYVWRQGNKVTHIDKSSRTDLMEIVGEIISHLSHVDKAFIDKVGLGEGIYSRLRELGYGDKVIAVDARNKPEEEARYFNKRAECWGRMKEWLDTGSILNDDEMHADLTSLQWAYDSNGRVKLESKQELRKRGLPSPDFADALSFTFAYPVRDDYQGEVEVIRNEYNR